MQVNNGFKYVSLCCRVDKDRTQKMSNVKKVELKLIVPALIEQTEGKCLI